MQREFLNEFRPEVGQSTALRALTSLKQGRDEEISEGSTWCALDSWGPC